MTTPRYWEIRFRLRPTTPGARVDMRSLVQEAGFRFVRAPNMCAWSIDAASPEHALMALRTQAQLKIGSEYELLIDSVRPSLGTNRLISLPATRTGEAPSQSTTPSDRMKRV